MRFLFLLLCLPLATDCTPAKSGSSGSSAGSALTSSATSTTKKTSSSTATSLTTTTINPATAAGTMGSSVTMSPSDILTSQTMLFPNLTFTKTTATYFQVLRCAASYDLTTLQGQSLRNSGKTFSIDDRTGAWNTAVNDSRNCKYAGEYVISPSYLDIAAASGSFYYVANPCVDASNSTTGLDGCSYNLSFSNAVTNYTNPMTVALQQQAIQLSQAQSLLYADLNKVEQVAMILENSIELCETYYAFTETEHALQRGMIMLGLNIVGAAAGAGAGSIKSVSGAVGGKAGGAMMGGMLAQVLGGSIVANYLGIGSQVDVCLGWGNQQGQVSTQGMTTKETTAIETEMNSYQSKFHVSDEYNQLVALTSTNGTIAQDTIKLQNVIAAMNAMDQSVMSVVTLEASANKYISTQISQVNSGTSTAN